MLIAQDLCVRFTLCLGNMAPARVPFVIIPRHDAFGLQMGKEFFCNFGPVDRWKVAWIV